VTPYYEIDGVTLYHGDCLEVTEWLAADVLVTDPPYGVGWEQHGGHSAASRRVGQRNHGIRNDSDTLCRDAALSQWGSKSGAAFGSLMRPPPSGTKQVLVWAKPPGAGLLGANLGFRRDVEGVYLFGDWPTRQPPTLSSVLTSRVTGTAGYSTGHPHAKPLDILSTLILAAPPGIVADPFAGSGSTLLAARNLGRAAIGVEIEERYCEIAAQRLAQGVLL
jgi:site-specific DNA-methyltransferase (adenine-specific)